MTDSLSACLPIISRGEWGARKPKEELSRMPGPARYVFVHHGDSAEALDSQSCSQAVRAYQNYHMDHNGWSDLGYSFVVGEDGKVYEGRGWATVGAHTLGYNDKGIGICIIGNFNERPPNEAAVRCVQWLIQQGVEHGHVSADYTLKGHRDVGKTDCPGQKLYQLLQAWPRFSPGTDTWDRD